MIYLPPTVLAKSFTCPHCGAISMQNWWETSWNGNRYQGTASNQIKVGTCQHCEKNTVWIVNKMYYPDNGNAPFPNPDMPIAVKAIYQEAASIQQKSPRGAAALLRLAIQLLCKELGEPGKNINSDIANLVKKGLPPIVQQSLDILRVTGNDAVHPGQIDTEDPDVVANLFKLLNLVVDYMITLPNQVSGIYNTLPTDKLDGIKGRDKG